MTLIKICGITNLDDALAALDAGASTLGFNFYPRSPRYIEPEQARWIIDRLPERKITVGVFVNEELEAIERIASVSGVMLLQLHGDESPEYCATLKKKGHSVIKVFNTGEGFTLERVLEYGSDQWIMLDAGGGSTRGGTGQLSDWAQGQRARQLFPVTFLAGGLSPENVREAINEVEPFGVDACSSLEIEPGKKDHDRVRAFVAAVRAARSHEPYHQGEDTDWHSWTRPQAAMAELKTQPDELGHWGIYGGRYVPETLMAPLEELTAAYISARQDAPFESELASLLKDYAGRPTPLFYAARLTQHAGGARIYLKREDLLHTGAHKINNTLGQVLLARRMGKRRVIAETGAGQHGVATATVCALFGLECVVYMGAEDMRRQALNVFRMQLLGAEVREVNAGSRTLKDAINEALRDWVTNVADTYYLLGSALGPHPYPLMVRDFQTVIGREARAQITEREGRLPDVLVACVGGGSNSIGLFHPFLADESVRMIGVEAGGRGDRLGEHAARFNQQGGGRPGVLQGTMSYVLQDQNGQIATTHSISAGLDYASIGPEHAWLHDSGRVEYTSVSDTEALDAFHALSKLEGIIPALESAHGVAHAIKVAAEMEEDQLLLVNLSGRGDKDVTTVQASLEPRV